MVSNKGPKSVGELLMMPRTCEVAVSRSINSFSSREVAFCCPIASLSLRLNAAICFFRLATQAPVSRAAAGALRRGGFTGLRRVVFRRLVRFTATSSPELQQRPAAPVSRLLRAPQSALWGYPTPKTVQVDGL